MTKRPVNAADPLAEGTRRLDAGAPPPHVDAAVRNAARAAARRRRTSAWTLPAALAATVVVAFSLVVQVQRDEAPAQDAPAPADEAVATAVLQEAAPAPPATPLPMADDSAEKSAAEAAVSAPQALRRVTGGGETPEQWLERIEALEAAGRHEEAVTERRRLEEKHPGWLAEHAAQRD